MKARNAWAAAIGCAAAIVIACIVWIRQNPLPSYYDEALYAIFALIDAWALKTYGASGAYYAMLKVDPSPPGLRMLALPFTAVAGPSLAMLRAISIAGFLTSLGLTAIAVRRVAGEVAAAGSVALTVALPIVVLSSRMFHTEYAFLISVSLLLLGLTAKRATPLFAAGIGLGLLAKASFVFVGFPMLAAAALVFADRRRAIVIGSAIGCAIGALWWWPEWQPATRLLSGVGNYVRHGHPHYVYELLRCNFGFAVWAAIVMCFVAGIRRVPPLAIVCIAGAMPLIVLQAVSANKNPRLIAIPTALVAIAAAILLKSCTPRQQTIVFSLAIVQVIALAIPWHRDEDGSLIWRGVTEVMAPVPQMDWTRLRAFATLRGFARPRIAMLGEGYAFNPPQVRYAWPDLRGEVPVEALYEWTDRKPFDLRAAVERSTIAQLAITAPELRGEATDGQVPNNRSNAAFAAALARDPRFEGPYLIDVGVRRPALVTVFIRR